MDRRAFIHLALALALRPAMSSDSGIRLFLAGDVMTGRGVDQIMPSPVDPSLYEPYVTDARRYVELAESVNGPIAKPVDPAYPWGEALVFLERLAPPVRIINLETAITNRGNPWPLKGIHYRMHPAHVGCLTAARIGCCILANNHVLDWGYEGLVDTLATLRSAGIQACGAGEDESMAWAPAVIPTGEGRILVFACGLEDSGIPRSWAAQGGRPGVAWLPDLSSAAVRHLQQLIASWRRPGDLVVFSIHWGGNWGYAVPAGHRRFAQRLITEAGVDLVHGHSSHHPKGVEVWQGKLILYGCGDLINDYEGIGGYERFRDELALLYLPTLAHEGGRLLELILVPLIRRQMRLTKPSPADTRWLAEVMGRESGRLDTRIVLGEDGLLRWVRA